MSALATLFRKYLLPREGGLLAFALWLSVAGVALGVVQLMVVLGVMSGFLSLFERNYIRMTSELLVVPAPESNVATNIPAALQKVPAIAAYTPSETAQGMILKNGVGGVVIEGIDRETTAQVVPWQEIWVEAPRTDLEAKNPYWIWMGVQLAKKLKVKVGDSVDLMIAEGKSRRIVPFVVTALVKYGVYDYDLRYVSMDINVLNELFRRYHLEPVYKLRLVPGANLDAVARDLRSRLARQAIIKKWSDVHRNSFLAVSHQKKLFFLILQIIVGLAAMNVVNLLMMSTHQRRRDIAILRAMGMRFSQVFQFFLFQGAAVGLVGIGLGIIAGFLACGVLEWVQPRLLSESVYNVTRLPLRVRGLDVLMISGSGLLLCMVFSVVPALRAAMARPVGALRYE